MCRAWYDQSMFEDIQAVEDWLQPLSYAQFWQAVETWMLFDSEDRAHCDETIARGIATAETVLAGLKISARVALQLRFGLKDRIYTPRDAECLASVL